MSNRLVVSQTVRCNGLEPFSVPLVCSLFPARLTRLKIKHPRTLSSHSVRAPLRVRQRWRRNRRVDADLNIAATPISGAWLI